MRMLGSVTVRWLALLALCAAYLQGGLNKAFDFAAAIAEMQHFGVTRRAAGRACHRDRDWRVAAHTDRYSAMDRCSGPRWAGMWPKT